MPINADYLYPTGALDQHKASSSGTSATTSADWQDKVSLSCVLKGGTYVLMWFAEIRRANGSGKVRVRCRCETAGFTHGEMERSDANISAFAGCNFGSMDGGERLVKIQWANDDGSSEVQVRRARLLIFRIGPPEA